MEQVGITWSEHDIAKLKLTWTKQVILKCNLNWTEPELKISNLNWTKPELKIWNLNWPEISACFLLLIKIKFKSFRSIRSFRLHIFSSGQFQVELKKISSDQIRSNWIHFSSGQFRSGYFSGQPETWTGQPDLFQTLLCTENDCIWPTRN